MVETDATGRPTPDLSKIAQDLIPDVTETYDLGSANKRWAYLFAVIAVLTSIVIGGVVSISTIDSWLFINASTWINASLNVSENITAINITASGYFFGNGSQLTDINYTETDPYWSGNQSSYFNTTDILGFSYWNDTYATFNKTYADTLYLTSYTETDPLWSGNETNVAFKNEANVFTANQNLTGQNITAIDCIIFDSGGKICSGA